MKSKISILALVLACLFLFAACSSEAKDMASSAGTSTEQSTPKPNITIPTDKKETHSFAGTFVSDDEETVIPYIAHCYEDGTLVLECHENRAGTWEAVSDTEIHLTIDEEEYTARYSDTFKIFSFRFNDMFDNEEISIQLQTTRDPVEVARENDNAMIKSYEKTVKDLVSAFEGREGEIIFYGSSNFVKWETLTQDMAPYPVQNKSFGGSNDVSRFHYMKDLVYDAKPKIVVTFNDTNNWTSGQALETVISFREQMLDDMHAHLPETVVLYLSNTPNPLRYFGDYHDKSVASDEWTKSYCDSHDGFEYLDIVTPLTQNGEAVDIYWGSDHLHFSEEGYAALTPIVKAKIDEICEQYGITFEDAQ